MAKPLREIVPLNELSKATLTTYARGALNSFAKAGRDETLHFVKRDELRKNWKKGKKWVDQINKNDEGLSQSMNKYGNRSAGIINAIDRLSGKFDTKTSTTGKKYTARPLPKRKYYTKGPDRSKNLLPQRGYGGKYLGSIHPSIKDLVEEESEPLM